MYLLLLKRIHTELRPQANTIQIELLIFLLLKHYDYYSKKEIYINANERKKESDSYFEIPDNFYSHRDSIDFGSKSLRSYFPYYRFLFRYFDNLFQSVLKRMIPEIPFTSAMSGGIDSSLQLKLKIFFSPVISNKSFTLLPSGKTLFSLLIYEYIRFNAQNWT